MKTPFRRRESTMTILKPSRETILRPAEEGIATCLTTKTTKEGHPPPPFESKRIAQGRGAQEPREK